MTLTREKSPFFIGLVTVFFILTVSLSAVYFTSQLYEASQKPFWGDEIFGLEHSVRTASFIDLTFDGAKGQGSPAPLDYWFLKILDRLGGSHHFGLSQEVYYRLIANSAISFTPLLILLLFVTSLNRKRNPLLLWQLVLIFLAGIAFLFSRNIYFYAAEMRPYALWTSLYLITLAWAVFKGRRLLWIPLSFLALSATTSIFQILSLGLSYGLMHFYLHRKMVDSAVESAKIFAVPLLISLYYCLQVGPWDTGHQPQEWSQFLNVWLHESRLAILMLVAIIFCLIKKHNRVHAFIPLGFLILYLLGPAIFWVTKFKGFFFAERQYMYYDLAAAVFMLILSKLITQPVFSKKTHPWNKYLLILVIIVSFALTFRSKVVDKIQKSITHTQIILRNPQVLQKHEDQLPR